MHMPMSSTTNTTFGPLKVKVSRAVFTTQSHQDPPIDTDGIQMEYRRFADPTFLTCQKVNSVSAGQQPKTLRHVRPHRKPQSGLISGFQCRDD